MLKKIEKTITIELTPREVMEYNALIDRDTMKKGIPTEKGNKCPMCGTEFTKNENFCPLCGQKVRFIESDIIPL